MLELSLALGVTIQEIEQWPIDVIDEYRSLNLITPFTKAVDTAREGLLIEIVRNQKITKRSQYRTAGELLPYLSGGVPDYLEHPKVKIALNLIGMVRTETARANVCNDIFDEIMQQLKLPETERDEYLIRRLSEIYQQNTTNKE